MSLVAHCGYVLPGDNPIIDRAGHQCTAADSDEIKGRCRCIATHVHRSRDGDRFRFAALCPTHYALAGPEAVVR